MAHFCVKLSKNGSKLPNLLKIMSNLKSTISKTLRKKILLENKNSFNELHTQSLVLFQLFIQVL